MFNEFIRAFVLIFLAEMGDKSQIIAMTFATKYRIWDVMLGVTLGVVFNHALAIILGNFISILIPTSYIHLAAGFLFIIFGLNSLSIDEEEEIEDKKEFSPILTVAIAFFIGELGDKTQLATMTLAAESLNPFIVLLGTSTAMIATSSLGIFIGSKVGKKIPEISVKIASSLVFLIFGLIRVVNSIEIQPLIMLISLLLLAGIEIILIARVLKSQHRPIKNASQALYEKTKQLKKTLDSICLTEDRCGTCSGTGCLLGYIRYILNQARETEEYYDTLYFDPKKLMKRDFNKKKILDALLLILIDYNENSWIEDEDFVINRIKSSLEIMLFNSEIDASNILQYKKKAKVYNEKIGDIIEASI